MPDGYGFIRCENYLPEKTMSNISVSDPQFNLKTGDIIAGNTRIKTQGESSALLFTSLRSMTYIRLKR